MPSPQPWATTIRRRCFNEAEASLPRMPRHERRRTGAPVVASMRPRHLCLGCTEGEGHSSARYRRFNEAEASLPRMPIATRSVMRCHGLASMRPRHLCLGCEVQEIAQAVSCVASMRPRHLCLGCSRGAKKRNCPSPCFNEAEASLPRMLVLMGTSAPLSAALQ